MGRSELFFTFIIMSYIMARCLNVSISSYGEMSKYGEMPMSDLCLGLIHIEKYIFVLL